MSTFIYFFFFNFCSICVPAYRVPWLQNSFHEKIVKDQDDIWKKTLREQDLQNLRNSKPKTASQKCFKLWYQCLQIIASMLCFATYLLSFILHGFTIYVIIESWDEKIVLSKIFVIMSIAASVVIGEWGSERKKNISNKSVPPRTLTSGWCYTTFT